METLDLPPIIHRDGLILVIDKPSGLPVHKGPKAAGFEGAVLTDFLPHYQFGLPHRPEIAHRLDRDTSGCLILGRHRKALEALMKLFKNNAIEKTYLARVEGQVREESGMIDYALAPKDPARGWWMKLDPKGQEALTLYQVLERDNTSTLLELKPQTGRTHQLRVHCMGIGHPIIGDAIYGAEPRFSTQRLMLHAQKISLPHNLKVGSALPRLEVEAPLPLLFKNLSI